MQNDNIEQLKLQKSPPKHVIRFVVGELLPWKGTWFEVIEVTADGLVLRARKPIEKKHG